MIPMDCHTHTGISPDGIGIVAEHVQQASVLRIPVLAVTEHVEMNRFFSQGYYGMEPRNEWEVFCHMQVMEQAMENINASKEFALLNGVTLLAGMEMGQSNADFSLSEIVQRDRRLDFVIASLHELLEKPDFFCLDYDAENVPFLLETYFSQLYAICKWGKFDVLGHITYPLRYIVGEYGAVVDLHLYEEQIRCCLHAVIENGCGIELNTSGLRQKYGKPFPTMEYIKMYHDMGGKILTLGSDAHRKDDIGKGIEEGLKIAKEAGFSYLCYFKRREPVFISI